MDKLSAEDIAAMEGQLRQNMEEDRRYWRVNDVKCDAIHTAKTYEEFAYPWATVTTYHHVDWMLARNFYALKDRHYSVLSP